MIKDIGVHLTGSDEDEVRLAYAEIIGERFEAHLTGLYAHVMPEVYGVEPGAMVGMEILFESSNARAQETTTRLQARLDRLTMPHDILRFDVFSGTAGSTLAVATRTLDLFLATRPYGDTADEMHMEVSVLFGSGRACLFVPPKGTAPRNFGTVVVGWNGSREAARAVAEAMPFLRQASQVVVVVANEGQEPLPADDIARHLSRHDVATIIRVAEIEDQGAGAVLLSEVRRLGASLLVMGGYGHSRLRELVLGGATRHVLAHADIPVLMAR